MQEIAPKTALAQDRYVHVKRPRASQRYEAEKSKSAPYPQGQRDGLFNYDTIHGMKLDGELFKRIYNRSDLTTGDLMNNLSNACMDILGDMPISSAIM